MTAPVRSREVRLGIVMYGGVSLAVYENGVANELYRAVKGKGFYELIKQLIHSDIVVDIISGTSAGGINGIFLAYALANGRDFSTCANLWREQGDILKLLRKTSDETANSVLDSEGYYQSKLEGAFREMDANPDGDPEDSEIDLFVTGTHFKGRVYTTFDDKGDPIDVKDHRCVFLLSYRNGRKNPFAIENIPQLAKLARVTSGFPVAFAPALITAKPALNSRTRDVDAPLRLWGNLPDDENAYFLDGGVLDNKPFSYTIDAIFGRMADRKVDRMLFYVEPDPERFSETNEPDRPAGPPPNVADSAIGALIGIPGYESISGDLKSIAEHNDRVSRYVEMRESIADDPATAAIQIPDFLDDPVVPDDFIRLSTNGADQGRISIYRAARLMSLRDRAIQGILSRGKWLQPLRGDERHAAKILVDSFKDWPGDLTDLASAHTAEDTLRDFDIYYRLRRAFDVVYAIYNSLFGNDPYRDAASPQEYPRVWRLLNHHIQLYEILCWAMESAVDNARINISDLAKLPAGELQNAIEKWSKVQAILHALLAEVLPPTAATDMDESQFSAVRRDFHDRLHRWLLDHRDTSEFAPPAQSSNLLLALERQERAILRLITTRNDPVRLQYCRFVLLDSYLFPAAHLGDINSRDVIKTVRISPIDGHYGFKKGQIDGKVCGRSLGHFGGFLKSSWRANDILAGRLDAIAQLIECLVTPERMAQVNNQELALNFDSLLSHAFVKNKEPDLTTSDINALNANAAAALKDPRGDRAKPFKDFVERLVIACQREMLEEEVPKVIEVSIEQQREWNHYQRIGSRNVPFLPDSKTWKLGDKPVDESVLNYAAEKLLEDPQNSAPANGDVRTWSDWYNSPGYTVANETVVDGIPKSVLLEVTTTTALVLRNCLAVAVGPKWAARVTQNPVFRLAVDYPVRAANAFARFQRTGDEFSRGALVAFGSIALLLLLIGGYFHDPLLYTSSSGIQAKNVIIFVVAPLFTLLTLAFLTSLIWVLDYLVFLAALAVAFLLLLHGFSASFASFPRLRWTIDLFWNERRAVYVGGMAAVLLTAPAAMLWRRVDVLLIQARNVLTSVKRLAVRLDWTMNPKKRRAVSSLKRNASLEGALHDKLQPK